MTSRHRLVLVSALCLFFFATAWLVAEEARLLQYPTVHGDSVVFVYGGDLWKVDSRGGQAFRLTSHPGRELTPKFSPDGKLIAYSAEYSGSRQVYVIPSEGGSPRQLTFYDDVGVMPPRGGFDNWIQGFRPDGKILVRMNRTPWGRRPGRYFLVDPEGGLEKPLPLPIGGSASYSPDGTRLAYTPIDREFRTWKRYQGGRNQDLWIYDLEGRKSERLTDFAGTDNFPMWHGDTIYFTSDREHTLNLYAYEIGSGSVRKVTEHVDYDVLWPSLGPDAIVYMNGGWLYRLSLDSEQSQKIPVEIAGDFPRAVPHFLAVDGDIASADISPDGKRAVFEARGDLFSVPAEHGATRNLSQTQGIRERDPAWSPDGKTIVYLSDETGELEIWSRSQDGRGEARQVTTGGMTWKNPPIFSPDGKRLAFSDGDRRLLVLEIASGDLQVADTATANLIDTYSWSPDSRFVVYEKDHDSGQQGIAVYSLDEGKVSMLGDGMTDDFSPTFSTDGKYLFFLSNRDFQLHFNDIEFSYDNATRVYAASLDPSVAPLFPPRSDEVAVNGKEKAEEVEGNDKDEKKADQGKPEARVEIVPTGFVARTVALPNVEAGDYGDLRAVEGGVLYRRTPESGGPVLFRFDFEKREEKEVATGVLGYVVAANGEKLLYREGSIWKIASVKGGNDAKALDLGGLRFKLDPRAEWSQMFDEAWRIGRDWFYDPEMHGIDWDEMRERYGALVPHITSRPELDFILSQMVAELEAGHAYVQSGDQHTVERVEGGMIGAELEADSSGRYRIAKIFPGENWDDAWRSPLTEQGVVVEEGEFLLAIDGEELATHDNPYRLLEGKGNQQVTLTVGAKPTLEGSREIQVRTLTSEGNLRYLDWVKGRMRLADELSGGRVGYVHLPDTAIAGNRMLHKLFFSQVRKQGLILDDRYNGGGFIPSRMIEVLSRKTISFWARRGIESIRTPGLAHDGPKAMLINGFAASGGDALPYYFRQAGLGKIFGTTTWGGLIGISGNPMLVDGGGVLYPRFRIYDQEGQWQVENVGVAPDVEVVDLPELISDGGDPTLEAAVTWLLEEIEGIPGEPEIPSPADR